MPKNPRALSVYPTSLRELEVARVTDVTPGMRRVTLTGDQLGAFTSTNGFDQPAFTSPGFDDEFRLFFAYPGESVPVLPRQADGHLDYPKDPRPLFKVYTVRRFDPASRELDVEFVKHGVGVATTWAYRAKPGDRINLCGPISSHGMPVGFDWWLIAGDDTALPAIARLLEEAPDDLRAQVFIEVAENTHRQELRELPGVEVTWLSRDGAEPATTTHLLEAVRNVHWWGGAAFAWLAGEQSVVRNLRRHLVEDRGLDKTAIDFAGYWRRSEVVALEGDAQVPDLEQSTTAAETFHELAELVPPIAIRVAVELGVGDLISRGITTVPELAARTGSDQQALGKLLRYLHAIDLLHEPADGTYKLTQVGEHLANESTIDELSPTGVQGRQSLGIYGLAESIRTGRACYASVTGQDFVALRADQEYEDQFLEQLALTQPRFVQHIVTSGLLSSVGHLVIHSAGAGAQASAFTAAHPELKITICALPAQANWLRRDLPESVYDEQQRSRISVVEQSIFEPTPTADTVFIIHALAPLPDADAAHALRRAAENLATDGRILLIEDTFDAADLDEHDAEADLLALTRTGSGLRTDDELNTVIGRAGLTRSNTHTVGFGTAVHELVRAEG